MLIEQINIAAQRIAQFGIDVLFFNVLFFVKNQRMEFLTAFIIFSAVYIMFVLKFVNLRYFLSSIKILYSKDYITNKINNAINSQSAFWTSIGGAVGVGSIAGISAAVYFGGPGTIFWIIVCGLITMPLRYAEVYFGHKLRTIKDGYIVECGPFSYFSYTVKALSLPKISIKIFASLFVIAGVGAIAMQVNPMVNVLVATGNDYAKIIITLILCVAVYYVITGGLKRISEFSSKIAVHMSWLYIVSITAITLKHYNNIDDAITLIVREAFCPQSVYGGIITIMFLAFKRAIVSSEVGFGTTSLLHGRSDRESSKDEAKLGMIAPFFGNLVFCALNGIMLVASGAFTKGAGDIETMRFAFIQFHPLMNYILIIIIMLFGLSTIITWFYYANSSLKEITQKKIIIHSLPFLFCLVIFFSGLTTFKTLLLIIDFSTLLITIPNILVLLYLVNKSKKNKEKIY